MHLSEEADGVVFVICPPHVGFQAADFGAIKMPEVVMHGPGQIGREPDGEARDAYKGRL